MTHSSPKFTSYSPCPSNRKICVVNGSLTIVAGYGEIFLNKSMLLKGVLHVSKLSTNLAFIHWLTHELNCHIISLLIVCSRTKVWGRRLDVLGRKTSFTILSCCMIKVEMRNSYFYPSSKLHPPREKKYGFIFIALDILLNLLKLCFLYSLMELMWKNYIVMFVKLQNIAVLLFHSIIKEFQFFYLNS